MRTNDTKYTQDNGDEQAGYPNAHQGQNTITQGGKFRVRRLTARNCRGNAFKSQR